MKQGNLLFALMYQDNDILEKTINELKNRFGKIKTKSQEYDFDFTDYYEEEFGISLKKTITIFNKKINKKDLVDIKVLSNNIEKRYSENNKRKINIDPGFVNKTGVFLASFKKKDFKENLGSGVYCHKVLEFNGNEIKTFFQTFPDFKSKLVNDFFLNFIE